MKLHYGVCPVCNKYYYLLLKIKLFLFSHWLTIIYSHINIISQLIIIFTYNNISCTLLNKHYKKYPNKLYRYLIPTQYIVELFI